jgi:hypothetical protein
MSLGMNGTIHLPIFDLPPMYDNAIIFLFNKYKNKKVKKQVSLLNIFYYLCCKLIFTTMEPIKGQIIEERDINSVDVESFETPKKECKSCKQKGLTKGQQGLALLGTYLLFASIYGTIKLVKDILNYFGY